MTPTTKESTGTARWGMLALISAGFIALTLNWFDVAAAFPLIGAEFGVGLGPLSLLISLFLVGYGVAHIPGGMLATAIGMKKTLFNGGTPFLLAGSVAGALKAVAASKDLDAETVVPGHGPVTGPGVIDDVLAYLRFVADTARDAVESDVAPLGAARSCDLGKFAELTDTERLVGNLHRAVAELRGTPAGEPMDFAAALADMRAYKRRQP